MKNGKLVAISAVSASLSLMFLIIGAYIPTLDISCIFMASVCVMLPLSKNSVKGGILAFLATAILSYIFVAGRFGVAISYSMFFGLHPIINYYQIKNQKTFSILTIVKCVWFVITAFVMYYLLSMFVFENEFLLEIIPYVLGFGGAIFFIIYDLIMMRFQKMLNDIIERIKL